MTTYLSGLKNGVVLAELGGHGNGPYCARHGAGAALAMMGTYIVDPGDKVPYPAEFVFKPGRASYQPYLRSHVAAARGGGSLVGVSVLSTDMADSMDFLAAAEEAGADFASICAHSSMDMFVQAGVDEEHFVRKGSRQLDAWARAVLGAVSIPAIFKIGRQSTEDTLAAVDRLAEIGVPIVHINVGDTEPGSDGFRLIRRLAGRCGRLVVGGGIADEERARRVLGEGADAVALGAAAMKDPDLCGRLQRALRPS